MTNRDLARRFADAHPHFLYDAVILEGVVAGGRVHGRIFFDKRGRHFDDTIVSTSSILEAFAGGRVIRTRNSQYLVQMQPETEQRRREASLEPESLEVDPVALHAHFDQANDALVESREAVRAAPIARYVAGFMFSPSRHDVALVRKVKPQWQAGRLNAIGGKIEAGETPIAAMVREFAEETGVTTTADEWGYVAVLKGVGFRVDFFAAFSDQVYDVQTIEAEEIVVGPVVGFLADPSLIPNLRVFLPLALDETGIARPVAFADVSKVAA